MPWVEVAEPFAAPPRRLGPAAPPGDEAVIELDDAGVIIDAVIRGPLDISSCSRLEIRGSVLRGVSFEGAADVEIDFAATHLANCDLQGIRVMRATDTHFDACRLSGCDLGGAVLNDVAFDDSVVRMTNLRLAELGRVRFDSCTLDEVDLHDATLSDVAFPATALRTVEVDRTRFATTDLRGATEIDLRSCRRFEGCLLSENQIVALAFVFAAAAGAAIERPDPDR